MGERSLPVEAQPPLPLEPFPDPTETDGVQARKVPVALVADILVRAVTSPVGTLILGLVARGVGTGTVGVEGGRGVRTEGHVWET